jgi:hypothetical protein
MVAVVASEWGVRRPDEGPGKVVWFSLQPNAETSSS